MDRWWATWFLTGSLSERVGGMSRWMLVFFCPTSASFGVVLAPLAEVTHCKVAETLGGLVLEVFHPVVATFQEEAYLN